MKYLKIETFCVTFMFFTIPRVQSDLGNILNIYCTPNDGYPYCSNMALEYDIIIIGAGTAGSVLGNRLSEVDSWSVLLIEDGDYPSDQSNIPLDFIKLQGTSEDWAFRAHGDGLFLGMNNQENLWPQGHLVGGGSGINAMIFTTGVKFDYDTWCIIVGDTDWCFSNIKKYFDKLKKNVFSKSYVSTALSRVYLNLAAIDRHIPVNNYSGIFGFFDTPLTVYNSQRFSMAKAYLKPIVYRTNFCLRTKMRVIKIIIDQSTMTAIGVQARKADGTVVTIRARLEVILSAGAINSPKLLMLSGIGPQETLTAQGIPVIKHLPAVGNYLKDHLVVPIYVTVPDIVMPDYNLMKTTYCKSGTLLDNIELANFLAFLNTKNNLDYPNIEFIPFEFYANDPVYLPQYCEKFNIIPDVTRQLLEINKNSAVLLLLVDLLHPSSYGNLTLVDGNIDTKPYITPYYLSQEEDIETIVESIQEILIPLLNATGMNTISSLIALDLPLCNGYEFASDDYWICYMKMFGGTIYHPIGTCRMGASELNSVIDSRMRVWGINNLRVIDSSTFPEHVSGHTNIPTCMVAEHGADIVKVDNGITIL